MPRIVRHAQATWEGSVARGAGTLTAASSGAFAALPVTLASRISGPGREDVARGAARRRTRRLLHHLARRRARARRTRSRARWSSPARSRWTRSKGRGTRSSRPTSRHAPVSRAPTTPSSQTALAAADEGLPVLGPAQARRRRGHRHRNAGRRTEDGHRSHRHRHLARLPDRGSREDRERRQRRTRPARRHVGLARRGSAGPHEPGGADRRSLGVLLLDGALARARRRRRPRRPSSPRRSPSPSSLAKGSSAVRSPFAATSRASTRPGSARRPRGPSRTARCRRR